MLRQESLQKLQPWSPCHADGPLLTSGLPINSLSRRSPPSSPHPAGPRPSDPWSVRLPHPPRRTSPTVAPLWWDMRIHLARGPYQPYKQIIAPLEVMLAHQYQWACGGAKEWDNKIMKTQTRHRGRVPTGGQINCSTPTWNTCWWMTVIVC